MASFTALYVLLSLAIPLTPTLALPTVAFPFNAQVPLVARVNSNYTFTFSASTFYPSEQNTFVYTLSSAAPWLACSTRSKESFQVVATGSGCWFSSPPRNRNNSSRCSR